MSRRIFAAVFAATFGVHSGCSLTLEFEECRSDLDCRNQEGVDLVCSSANVCEPRLGPEDIACGGDFDCLDVLGANHVCAPAGHCVDLLGQHCSEVWRPASGSFDRITYLPVVLPPGAARNATRMAVEDFAAAAPETSYAIGWLGCDRTTIEPLLDAGVPAFVGGRNDDDAGALLARTVPAGALLVTPAARSHSLGNLALLWRTVGSDAQEARAIAARLEALDPPPTQVLTLAPNDLTGRTFREAFSRELLARIPAVNEAVLLYTPASAFQSGFDRAAGYAEVAREAVHHHAQAVVLLGLYESSELALQLLAQRDQVEPRPPLPRLVFARDGVPFMPLVLDGVAPSFREILAPLIEGITPRYSTPDRYAAYRERYAARFGVDAPPADSAAAYDAAMLTLFAIAGSSRPRPSGREISGKIPGLVTPGAPVVDLAFDPEAWTTGLSYVRQDEVIDVDGMTGTLQFDATTQTVTSAFLGWDVRASADGSAFVLREARVFEDAWSDL